MSMKKHHADSQVDDREAVRLMQAALGSPEHRGSQRLERAMQIRETDMLGRWSLATPEGQLHRVAHVRVLDGETIEDAFYRDEQDAVAVWEYLAEAYRDVR